MATIRATAGMRTESPPLSLFARRRARRIGFWPALWLVACLLLAQHAGLVHRVVHGGLLNATQTATQAATQAAVLAETTNAGDASHDELSSLKLGGHSCVIFDGATLADGHVIHTALPQLVFGKPVNPANLAWRWPDLPAARPFQSRAPPAAFAFA